MSELEEIIDLVRPDAESLSRGRERQSATWKGAEPDCLPLLLGDAETPELSGFEHHVLKEQYYDREKMLAGQLKGLVGIARAGGDAQLCIRANLGVGTVPSVVGLEPVFPQDDQMPWFSFSSFSQKGKKFQRENGGLSKKEIEDLNLDDIENRGLIPRAVDYIQYFKEYLPTGTHIYCFDTQGPFDIAHLIRGNSIYTDVYDDPDFVHRLLNFSTRLYIEVTKVCKEAIGEKLSSGYHSGTLYMAEGGVRLCDDTSINLSPPLFRKFCLPYIQKALRPFGGGWVHFCGDGNHLLDMYLELDEVKGVNFGNPEKFDYGKTISKIVDKGKFYFGAWPMENGENLRDYFRRLLNPLGGKRKGLMLQLTRGKGWPSCEEILKMWCSI